MYEVPDWEEIKGTDPNDAKNFGPGRTAPKVVTGPRLNRWFIVARTDNQENKKPNLALKIQDDEMYWFRPDKTTKDMLSKLTVFTDITEADQAKAAAAEKFPEFTIWWTGFTVAE